MKKLIYIAASSTGGHILPAIYIAQELEKLIPEVEIEFIGSGRRLEKQLIGAKGYRINNIPIVGVSRRGISGKAEFLLKLPKALYITSKLFLRKPIAVIGVGGYVSVLPVALAKLYSVPSLIHEVEKSPGLANKFLSYFATISTVAFNETKFPSKIKKYVTGQPLNPKLYNIQREACEKVKNVLIVGGSLGSNALDNSMRDLSSFFKEKKYCIHHQCRKENIGNLNNSYQNSGIEYKVETFIEDISLAYNKADLIISRAGANTMLELELVGKRTIVVPLPNAPEQRSNALLLSKLDNMEMIDESDALSSDIKSSIENLEKINGLTNLEASKLNSAREIALKLLGVVD